MENQNYYQITQVHETGVTEWKIVSRNEKEKERKRKKLHRNRKIDEYKNSERHGFFVYVIAAFDKL